MVSFPLLASESLAKHPIGFSTGAIFFSSFKLAIPSFCILGMESVPTASAICPNVSVPASPKRSASFDPPIPQESITIVKILRYFFASIFSRPIFCSPLKSAFQMRFFPLTNYFSRSSLISLRIASTPTVTASSVSWTIGLSIPRALRS